MVVAVTVTSTTATAIQNFHVTPRVVIMPHHITFRRRSLCGSGGKKNSPPPPPGLNTQCVPAFDDSNPNCLYEFQLMVMHYHMKQDCTSFKGFGKKKRKKKPSGQTNKQKHENTVSKTVMPQSP